MPTTTQAQEMTRDQKIELFRQIAIDPQARANYAASRAEVILPMLPLQSTVRSIFKVEVLAPGADAKWDIPFDDIEATWVMPHIGGIPTIQVEGAEIHVDTFGIEGGVEFQMDIARDGRFPIGALTTTLLKNKFIAQEELSGWGLIKVHAAGVPNAQVTTGFDTNGNAVAAGGGGKLNIFTLNEVITVGDNIGLGGRKVTDIFMTPRRFGDLRNEVARFGLPEDMRKQIWNGGRGTDQEAEIRFHRVYNKALIDDNTAYAFTQKEGYFYGVMPIREELSTRENPMSINEWKVGIIGRERVGFGIMDDKGLVVIKF